MAMPSNYVEAVFEKFNYYDVDFKDRYYLMVIESVFNHYYEYNDMIANSFIHSYHLEKPEFKTFFDCFDYAKQMLNNCNDDELNKILDRLKRKGYICFEEDSSSIFKSFSILILNCEYKKYSYEEYALDRVNYWLERKKEKDLEKQRKETKKLMKSS